MDDELDSGLDTLESPGLDADTGSLDVDSFMDSVPEMDEFGGGGMLGNDDLDIDSIMNDVPPVQDPLEEVPQPVPQEIPPAVPGVEDEIPVINEVEEEVPVVNEVEEEIPVINNVEEEIPVINEVEEEVPVTNEVEEEVPVINNVEEEIPVTNEVEEEIPVTNEVEEEVPVINNVEEEIPVTNEVEEEVPVINEVEEEVPVINEVEEEVPVINNVEEEVPVTNKVEEEIPVINEVEEEVPVINKVEEEIPITNEVEEEVPVINEVEEEVPVINNVEEEIPVTNEVEEEVPVINNVEEEIPVTNEVEEEIPVTNEVEEEVPVTNEVEEEVPVINEVEEEVPVINEVEEEVPVTNEVEEEIPVTNEVEEEIPVTNEVEEEVPVINEVEEEIPVTNEVEEEVPVTNEVEEEVPVTDEVEEEVPVTDEVEEEVPVTNEVEEEVPVTNEVEQEIPAAETEQAPDQNSGSALAAMGEYLSEHNYGREDYAEYSQDPEWQRLNNDLLVEMGEEPIDYSAQETGAETPDQNSGSALAAMGEYLSEHNYGREDYAEYSQDPEWQRLNNDLLVEMGQEPIDYSAQETGAETPAQNSGSALAAMGEYLSEHNYGREDYAEYSKDPEWQRLNNDLLVEMGQEPIDYSAQETGAEIPQVVEEVPAVQEEVTEVLPDTSEPVEEVVEPTGRIYDDFEESIRVDQEDFYESGTFYTQGINEYGYTSTCGETSMASTMNLVLGTNEYTENKVLDVAVQEGLCDTESFDDSGGTTTDQFMALYEKMNETCGGQLEVERHDFENVLSMEEVAKRLEEGCTINVAVDADTLWDQRDPMGSPFPETKATDHWITVTDVHRDENGAITGFDIIDSGGGESYVDAQKYEAMCYGTDSLELTDPTCIVVSKKNPDIAPKLPDLPQDSPDLPPMAQNASIVGAEQARIFANNKAYEQFSACPEDSDEAFELQRVIHRPERSR